MEEDEIFAILKRAMNLFWSLKQFQKKSNFLTFSGSLYIYNVKSVICKTPRLRWKLSDYRLYGVWFGGSLSKWLNQSEERRKSLQIAACLTDHGQEELFLYFGQWPGARTASAISCINRFVWYAFDSSVLPASVVKIKLRSAWLAAAIVSLILKQLLSCVLPLRRHLFQVLVY